MKIFITGASGYIGRHVALELLSRGHDIVGMARRQSPRTEYSDAVEWCFADLSDHESYQGVSESCDAVVHCAMDYSQAGSENFEMDAAFVRQFAGSDQHFVYTGNLFSPRKDPTSVLNESQIQDGFDWRFENENLVLGSLQNSAVIRLGFVYGENGGYLFDILSPGTVFGIDVEDLPDVRWPMIHVRDVATLYADVLERKATGVFHAYDGCVNSAREIIESVIEVYRSRGIQSSDAHDYVQRLLQSSIVTTNSRSLAAGWTPGYKSFSDQADQAFEQLEGLAS